MSECATYLGNYGNGTIGLKTSIPGWDVRDLSQDDNSNARSFNSNWSNLVKIKTIGVAQGTTTPVQTQRPGVGSPAARTSGWGWVPAAVATGLNYIPMWEERVYDQASRIFYDDKLFDFGNSTVNNFSGSRSYFSGPGLPPNIVWFEPWMGSLVQTPAVTTAFGPDPNTYPPFPPFPPQPVSPVCAYIIYANKLGDVS